MQTEVRVFRMLEKMVIGVFSEMEAVGGDKIENAMKVKMTAMPVRDLHLFQKLGTVRNADFVFAPSPGRCRDVEMGVRRAQTGI